MREQQILHKIKKGDQQTLNNFIQDLYPYVYSFTYQMCIRDRVCTIPFSGAGKGRNADADKTSGKTKCRYPL